MVNFGANLYNALPQSFTGGNRSTASNFSLQAIDESARSGNSLRLANQQFRQQSGLPDFSPPAKGQEGFASLGPVLKKFQPDITPLHELSGPTSWERLLEEQKRISAAREQSAREFENLLNNRSKAQAEQEKNLQLVEKNAERALFDAEPQEDFPDSETEDNDNEKIGSTAQDVLNNLRSDENAKAFTDNQEQSQPRNESVPLPGQGTRIDDPYQPEDEAFENLPEPEKPEPLPGSGSSEEQQQVARLFSTANNSGSIINLLA